MSAAAVAAPPRRGIRAGWFGDVALAATIFLGGFVIFEPAPYDLLLVGLIGLWAFAGLRISRYILPLVLLLLLYLIGGLVAFFELRSFGDPFIYYVTTVFLAASSILYAAVIPAAPERRLTLMMRAYVASAVVAGLIGILAYFEAIPYSELFKLYDRARGPFQDPNVFGPFLVLPTVFLVYRVLTHRLRESAWHIAGIFVLLAAIFLSFSRAAWGMTVLAILITACLAYINQRGVTARMRLVAYSAIGLVVVIAFLAAAISIPAVSELFDQRAKVVQDYDAGELGRFERHALGFLLAFDKPLGLGPFQFGARFGEDEHNMWLKGFMVYGWLGGFAYIALVVWTLVISVPLLFKPRPWQPVLACTFAVYLGHLLIHNVIDNDHWRHLFLLYGILWGGYAAERLRGAAQPMAAATGPPIRVFHALLPRAPSVAPARG